MWCGYCNLKKCGQYGATCKISGIILQVEIVHFWVSYSHTYCCFILVYNLIKSFLTFNTFCANKVSDQYHYWLIPRTAISYQSNNIDRIWILYKKENEKNKTLLNIYRYCAKKHKNTTLLDNQNISVRKVEIIFVTAKYFQE